jgi:hypothetical protein
MIEEEKKNTVQIANVSVQTFIIKLYRLNTYIMYKYDPDTK